MTRARRNGGMWLTATVACSCISLGSGAQAPVSLGKPEVELAEPFASIESMRELRDGRVLVVDQKEKRVLLVDFKAGKTSDVGRIGAGPGEFAFPGRIIALPGDTSALHDGPNVRFLLITPDGKAGNTFQLDQTVAARLGSRGSIPRGTDARGRIFFEGSPIGGRGGALQAEDSVPVMRYDRSTSRLDTLAYVHLAEGNVKIGPGPGGRGNSITVGALAFPARDDWVPTPDGGVAVVRVRDYHMDRYSPSGARTSGPPLKFTPVVVTETDRQAWRDDRIARMSPRNSRTGTPPPGPVAGLREPEWSPTMPPFEYWRTVGRSNGEVWVLRYHPANEPATYDVFNQTGSLVRRVSLPPKTHLVGFGEGTVYLARRDDDDLQYLQRYRFR